MVHFLKFTGVAFAGIQIACVGTWYLLYVGYQIWTGEDGLSALSPPNDMLGLIFTMGLFLLPSALAGAAINLRRPQRPRLAFAVAVLTGRAQSACWWLYGVWMSHHGMTGDGGDSLVKAFGGIQLLGVVGMAIALALHLRPFRPQPACKSARASSDSSIDRAN